MRFSLNFLKEFLDVDVSTERLASLLTMAGIGVGEIAQVSGDVSFEIEVTSNRYDWLSMVGIARELAARLNTPLRIDQPRVMKTPAYKEKNIIIKDSKDCSFYVARYLNDVGVKESPAWLKERVLHCGVNSINNIVDITNYCMLKWGNPLHAFDARKVEGNIYIRRAKDKERFIGLDDKERILDSANLVIADDKKIIALAGIMGARNSEVDNNTKDVILEAAIFSPLTVRLSRRAAGIETDSSYRFERQVFVEHLEYASMESAQMMEKLSGAHYRGYKEAGKRPVIRCANITLDVARVNDYLGTAVDKKVTKKILLHLGCKVKDASAGCLKVTPPAFRFDIKEEIDLYEEVARVYGFENIPCSYPCLEPSSLKDATHDCKVSLRNLAVMLGLKEIITFSIEADKDLMKLGETGFVKLTNPLRAQENVMRPTLLSGMIKTMSYNFNRSRRGLRFFEIANTYVSTKDTFVEKPSLAIGVSNGEEDFFYLKAIIEKIARFTNVNKFALREAKIEHFNNALAVFSDTTRIGFLGKLDSKLRDDFDLKEDLFFAQLDIDMLRVSMNTKVYEPFSTYPEVFRDISIALRNDKQFLQIKTVLEDKGNYIIDYRITNTYTGKDLAQGYRAFTLRVYYQSKDRTLTSQEVDSIHTLIRENLASTDGILLR